MRTPSLPCVWVVPSAVLELDAKECAEWCVDGYLGNLSSFD
jgi:hypothetical protein